MTGSESGVQPFEGEWLPPPPEAETPPEVGWVPPPPAKDRRVLLRPVSALLFFAAALLTLFGSFMTLGTGTYRFQTEPMTSVTITSWEMTIEQPGGGVTGLSLSSSVDPVPMSGVPLMFAAVVLLAAAVLGLLAAAAPGSLGIARLTGITAAIGAALLVGTAWTVGMEMLYWAESFRLTDSRVPNDFATSFTMGTGFWLLAAAVVAAVGAAVVAWRASRVSQPAMAREREEPETPRFGIPVVVRLPDEPQQEP